MIQICGILASYRVINPVTKKPVDMVAVVFKDENDRKHVHTIETSKLPAFYEDREMKIPKILQASIKFVVVVPGLLRTELVET